PYSSTNLAANARAVVALGDRQSASRPQRPPGSAHTDEKRQGLGARVPSGAGDPDEKSRHLGSLPRIWRFDGLNKFMPGFGALRLLSSRRPRVSSAAVRLGVFHRASDVNARGGVELAEH